MKKTLLLLTMVIVVLPVLAATASSFHWPSRGKVVLAIWRALSSEAHGGHYASINGVRIYYETYGSGQPVLVLHGGNGFLEDMQYQIRALAATRFVVAADSRGHGRSTDASVPLSYSLMADDMLKLLDQMNIPRADILGWSDGGIIALDLAMHHPERVGRLVVIGANYDVDGLADRPVLSAPPPPIPRFYARHAPDPSHWPVIYQKVVTMWATQPNYTLEDLGRIHVPSLVMAGEFDVIKRQHTDRLAHALPDCEEFVVPGATHAVMSDEPDIVNARVLRFLERAWPGS